MRLTMGNTLTPVGVGLLSEGVDLGIQNAQRVLDQRIAEGAESPDAELNAFVRNLPDIVDIGLGVLCPTAAVMNWVPSDIGPSLSGGGLAVGSKAVVGMIGRGILGLNDGSSPGRYRLDPYRVEEKAPAAQPSRAGDLWSMAYN